MQRSSFQLLLTTMLVLLTIHSGNIAKGARILALVTTASRSHSIFHGVLLNDLAARGHQVIVFSPFEINNSSSESLTYIKQEMSYDTLAKVFQRHNMTDVTPFAMIGVIYRFVAHICENKLKSESVKTFINYTLQKTFDLIITEDASGECFLGFIPYFGSPPVIVLSPSGLISITASSIGTPEIPSYIPNIHLPYAGEMNFFQRMFSFVFYNIAQLVYVFLHTPNIEGIAEKYLNRSFSFYHIQRNYTLLLANVVPGFDGQRPLSPNVIPIGGMHIKEGDPLPQDVQDFLDEAKAGFIYFNLGSNLKSETFPINKLQALLDAFSELPQRVLWKSDNLTETPPNVKTGKWFSQNEVLAHPNIRLFISHCGKLSVIESIHKGVPIVGIPMMEDQHFNMEALKENGAAVRLDYTDLSKESVLKAVNEIINNSSYRENMKKMSAILKDQPETPLERAVFWVEYVLRHGGAPLHRPVSIHMHLFEYLLFDVIAIFVLGMIVLLIPLIIFRNIYRKLRY